MTTMMINDIYSKWKTLVTKNDGVLSISAFYVSKKCPSKLFFGYDGEKKYIYLEFEPATLASFKCPKAKGLEINIVDVPEIEDGYKYIRITNIDNKDEVFFAFCNTLYDGLVECLSYFDVAETLTKTIRYYKSYFSNPNKPLTEEEEQGLYCELVYLEKLIVKDGQDTVKNWEGPSRNKRDFVFEDKSIEIKSTISQIFPSIRISNELQLDSTYPENINLFLKVYVLEKVEEGDSLTKAARRIENALTDIETRKNFKQKLLMDKVDLSLYEDINHYSIQKEKLYIVDDDFPSITRAKINDQIFKVEYYVSLAKLEEWEVDE